MTPAKKTKAPSKWRKNGEGKHYPFMNLSKKINAKQVILKPTK